MGDVPGTPGSVRLVAGRYRLLSPLGEGVTGFVWRARDEMLGREVAVREISAPASADAGEARRLYDHLENAARTAGRVSHRNVVAVHDVATDDGRPWIVMELVRGLTLADVLDAEGPLPPHRAAHIGAEILAALRAAHAAGVPHGDVKPSNVLIANDGRVMVTDFGTLTADDTPGFGAPERAPGRAPRPESDLWSLGALLRAAVSPPSRREWSPSGEEPSPSREEGLPPGAETGLRSPKAAGAADGLGPVVAGLLRPDPADRLDGAEAEHQLRLASAGGGVRTDTPASASSTDTAPSTAADRAGEPDAGPAARQPAAVTAAATGPDETRRATAVLAVGVALMLLIVAALVWVLVGGGG
ncbi:protein kinase [Streptomyces sp. NPDC003023]|uniref:protein kinase domain-containing protein n=1 Tax=Streptomyces sp. NPDC003023 TaxID=3364675 RepID=UPI0036BD7860